jgi:hypothetical protein
MPNIAYDGNENNQNLRNKGTLLGQQQAKKYNFIQKNPTHKSY